MSLIFLLHSGLDPHWRVYFVSSALRPFHVWPNWLRAPEVPLPGRCLSATPQGQPPAHSGDYGVSRTPTETQTSPYEGQQVQRTVTNSSEKLKTKNLAGKIIIDNDKWWMDVSSFLCWPVFNFLGCSNRLLKVITDRCCWWTNLPAQFLLQLRPPNLLQSLNSPQLHHQPPWFNKASDGFQTVFECK